MGMHDLPNRAHLSGFINPWGDLNPGFIIPIFSAPGFDDTFIQAIDNDESIERFDPVSVNSENLLNCNIPAAEAYVGGTPLLAFHQGHGRVQIGERQQLSRDLRRLIYASDFYSQPFLIATL